MAAVVGVFCVKYHFEIGGRASSIVYRDYCQAAAGDYNSLKTVLLTNNNRQLASGTLVLDAVQEVGHAEVALA